jgi:hypothetical protein
MHYLEAIAPVTSLLELLQATGPVLVALEATAAESFLPVGSCYCTDFGGQAFTPLNPPL